MIIQARQAMSDAAELKKDSLENLVRFRQLRENFEEVKAQRDRLVGKIHILNAQSLSLSQ